MTQKIMRRIDAIDAGETYYYTGKPCHKGHIALRYTLSAQCKDCVLELGRGRYERIKAKFNQNKDSKNGNN